MNREREVLRLVRSAVEAHEHQLLRAQDTTGNHRAGAVLQVRDALSAPEPRLAGYRSGVWLSAPVRARRARRGCRVARRSPGPGLVRRDPEVRATRVDAEIVEA